MTAEAFYEDMIKNRFEDINNSCYHDFNICVLWSGGCDSTLLLTNILNKMKTHGNRKCVRTYSIIHNQLGNKIDYERNARMKFMNWAASQGFPIIKHQEILIDNATIVVGPESCPQPALWISQIIPFISIKALLFAGYIHGDDFLTFGIFNSWFKVFSGLVLLNNKEIIFRTPLCYTTKTQVLESLKQWKVYDFTWHCETPSNDGKECGYCDPCKKHNHSLYYIACEEEKQKMNKKEEKKVEIGLKCNLKLFDEICETEPLELKPEEIEPIDELEVNAKPIKKYEPQT